MSAIKRKNEVIPRLRFADFCQVDGWTVKRLKDACEINPASSEIPEEFIYVDLESVEAGELKNRNIIGRDEAPSRAQRLLRYGDVIFQVVRPYQRNNLHFKIDDDMQYVASTGYAQLRANESDDFLFQAIQTDDFVERVIAKCTGSSYPAINSSDLAEISIPVPNISEQKKIADCLSSIDELISAEARKLDVLKTHKKGLMQQLFPAEGETVPRLRFPEFQDVGSWEEKRLEELAKRGSGHTPSKAKGEYYDGEIKWVSLADSNRLDKGLISETTIKISNEGLRNSSAVLHPAGTVILSRDAGVGKSAVMASPMAVSQHFIAWVCNPFQLHNRFLYYILQKEKPLFERIATGSTIKTIGLPFFVEMQIKIPSLVEQLKIADLLLSADKKIVDQGQKIEILKRQKIGLMQQLFPVMDEMQG